MKTFLIIIITLLFSHTLSAENFTKVFDNESKLIYGLKTFGKDLYAYGTGPSLLKLDKQWQKSTIFNGEEQSIIFNIEQHNDKILYSISNQTLTKSFLCAYADDKIDTIKTFEDLQIFDFLKVKDNTLFIVALAPSKQRTEIYSSINGGKDWTLQFPKNNEIVVLRTISHYKDDIIFGVDILSGHTIISQDMGKTWQKKLNPTKATIVKILIDGDKTYLMSNEGMILKSENNLENFEIIYNNPTLKIDAGLCISGKNIYAISSENGKSGILVHSKDAGKTWDEIFKLEDERIASIYMSEQEHICFGTQHGKIYKSNEPVGVKDDHIKNTKQLSIFPNPCKTYINIKGEFNSESKIRIYDIFGNDCSHLTSRDGTQVNVDQLKKGMYFLLIAHQHIPFIKQ